LLLAPGRLSTITACCKISPNRLATILAVTSAELPLGNPTINLSGLLGNVKSAANAAVQKQDRKPQNRNQSCASFI
jgi:hypothetical protein